MLYEMMINDELTDGVFAISLVTSPAIQENYVLLSKNTIKIELETLREQDKKKRIVCGPILIPNKVIPRDGFDIKFSEDTIRKCSELFLINGNKDNVTLEHQIKVNKVHMVESWIVINSDNDKSKELGFDVPVGTWMGSFKIVDEKLWNEYLMSGVLKGFSIEGNFTNKEISMLELSDNEIIDNNIEEIINKIKSIYKINN